MALLTLERQAKNKRTNAAMPTMAMEHDMTQFSKYARAPAGRSLLGGSTNGPLTKREKEQRAIQEEEAMRQSLLRRAGTCNAIAALMTEQNEQMLAGLKALRAAQPKEPPCEVNYIKRNMANVSPHRSLIGRKEQGMLARAEVMAAATTHLANGSGGGSTAARSPFRSGGGAAGSGAATSLAAAGDSATEALLRAARDEIERSSAISMFEAQTRRPPQKLAGLARAPAFSPSRATGFDVGNGRRGLSAHVPEEGW